MKAIEHTENNIQYVVIPISQLNEIQEKLNLILSHLKKNISSSQNSVLADYLSESEAKKQLGKGTTWFWNMRETGQLEPYKIGNKVYYKKVDLLKLLNKHCKKDL
jgi:hypothetical protein